MTWFIADTHFGHASIIRTCARPFSSVEEMDEALISAWNSRVGGNDTVYILGDMFFRCGDPEAVLRRLKGRMRLITGNHDATWMSRVDLPLFFESADPMLEIQAAGHQLTLCHYPFLTWKNQKKSFVIHGHIHNDTSLDYWPQIRCRENLLNAGVDVNGFRPVTFDELLANNAAFKAAHPGQERKSLFRPDDEEDGE